MSEFKGKNKKDLVKMLLEKREALQNFRFAVSGGKTRNVKEGRTVRKDIARIMTEITVLDKSEVVAVAAPKVKKAKATTK